MVAQKAPPQMINKLLAYIIHVHRLLKQFPFQPEWVIVMDETVVWSDMLSDTTVDKSGKKDVPIKSTVTKRFLFQFV